MTVGELLSMLSELDVNDPEIASAEIVTSGPDHSYSRARASLVTAETNKRGDYLGEYYEGNTGTGCKKVLVLVVT
jgi:hypothetical protein